MKRNSPKVEVIVASVLLALAAASLLAVVLIPAPSPAPIDAPPVKRRPDTATKPVKPTEDILAEPLQEEPVASSGVGDRIVVGLAGTSLDGRTRRALQNGSVGGIVLLSHNIVSAAQVRAINDQAAQAAADGGFPTPILCIDQEGGRVDRLRRIPGVGNQPSAAKMAKRGPKDIEREAFEVGTRLADLGFNVNFAPDVDLDQGSGVIGDRSYGVDPQLVERCAAAAIRGYRRAGIVAIVKHYPGHGMTTEDSHRKLPVANVSETTLIRHQDVFKRVMEEEPGGAMLAHLMVPAIDADLPASLSPRFAKRLRALVGKDRLIFTDSGSMDALQTYGDEAERATKALNAGVDIYLTTTPWSGLPRNFDARVAKGLKSPDAAQASSERIQEWRVNLTIVPTPKKVRP